MLKTGDIRIFYLSGKIKVTGAYTNGVKTGKWKEYDENNKVINETDYGKPKKRD